MSVADEIKSRADLAEIVAAAGVKLHRKGRLLVGCCPFHAERTGSFTLFTEDDPPRFHCFGCGASGTAIDFAMKDRGIDLPTAIRQLAEELGVSRDAPPSAEERARADAVRKARRADLARAAERRDERRRDAAADIWRGAIVAPHLLASYLAGRGIDLPAIARAWGEHAPNGVPRSLRFHATCPDFELSRRDPAMVGCVVDAEGRLMGVHRTFLTPALDAKRGAQAKKMLGRVWGGCVRLTPPARRLFVAEGIETGLTILAALSRAGEIAATSVACALSLNNLGGGGFGPTPDMHQPGMRLPPVTREVVICEDADNKDPEAAGWIYARAAKRWGFRGAALVRRARPAEGMDFNDMALRGAA